MLVRSLLSAVELRSQHRWSPLPRSSDLLSPSLAKSQQLPRLFIGGLSFETNAVSRRSPSEPGRRSGCDEIKHQVPPRLRVCHDATVAQADAATNARPARVGGVDPKGCVHRDLKDLVPTAL